MLTAAEIEEWDDMRDAVSYHKLFERAVKAERQRDELMRVMKEMILEFDEDGEVAYVFEAREAIAKIEGENNGTE